MTLPPDERVLNAEQKKAVEHGEGPLLIIAGAGTGKTTVITERIKHLITSGFAKPSEILALTFTEKASREMEDRVDRVMPYGYTQMWISTFHSFCERVLRQEAVHIGLNPAFRLLSDADATMIVRKNLFSLGLDYFRPLGNPTKFIGGMLSHFDRLRDEDVSPMQYLAWVNARSEEEKLEIQKYKELAGAYAKYQELKAKEGLMDFSDLIANTLVLFRTRKNILKEYQRQFKFYLIDEFQDTNIAQNELVKLLVDEKKNITAVADDDQSIYKFRGAAVSNVLSFRKHFSDAAMIVLAKNYRSTQRILDASYRLIQHNNPDRLEAQEGIDKHLVSVRDITGDPVSFIHTDRVENEAEEVAKEVKRQKENGKRDWKDFAILVRANNHAEPFVRALSRAGIPYQFLGPGQLFRQPEVKDLIAYLQVLANFEDNVALFRVLSMEYFDISIRDLTAIANFSRKQLVSFFEGCEACTGKDPNKKPIVSSDTEDKIKKFIEMINRHLALIRKETAGQILFYFLQDTGMFKNILDHAFPIDERKAANITKFFNKLKTYETEHDDASVTTVLDWILLSMELGESPLAGDTDWTSNDAVNILTVHSAKGLEFPIVFLVNLVGQRFPTIERREQIPIPEDLIKETLPVGDYHIEEERRLFYVGLTRARDRLYLTAADYYGEGKREKKLSPFVGETLGGDASMLFETQGKLGVNASEKEHQLSLLDWEKTEERETEVKQQHRVTYLSYSQIESFLLCPLHYKLRHILGIQSPPTPALSFGNSVHRALKDFYELKQRGENVDKKILLALLEKNWITDGYTGKKYEQEMRKRGEKYLAEYFKNVFEPAVTPVLLETPFTIQIRSGDRSLKIGGKIDRLDALAGGKIEIIDYKTGRVPTQRETDTSLQLSIYAMAAADIANPPFGKKPEDIVLSLYYFDVQKKISTTRTREQLGSEKEKIMNIAREIETSDFHCSGNQLCTMCEYKLFCGITGDSR
ncbi:ATP-dependent helicase [Candidatus Gottesmanbacteria bacterium]|nr:ATP-dependent helicase [Candidatus Gottesmanbacteria bacterium]